MFIFLGIILLIIIFLLVSRYYYYLFKRFYLIFRDNIEKKQKYILVFFTIIFSLLTINFFNVDGIFLLHFIGISVIFDCIVFLYRHIFGKKESKSIFLKKLYFSSIVPLVLTVIVFGYGYFNIRNVVETDYTVYTDKEIGDDLRILLITDVHYETIFSKEKLLNFAKRLNEVDADIVVLGGDIVDESTTNVGMHYIFEMFGSITNKYGIYFVYGNHDEQRYSNNKQFTKDELNQAITSNGIKIIEENYLPVRDNVIIVGRKDNSYGSRKSVEKLLKNVDSNKYIIMVDHQPIEYNDNAQAGVDLILSGHTHAGQIFPISLFIKLFHTSDLAYGNKKINNMQAIVSSGMAGWGYPIRTEKHSEYVVIDVKEK